MLKNMNRIYGYARVSTPEQSLEMQIKALEEIGCHTIFEEKASGKSMDRKVLNRLKNIARKGDTIAIWKLDRLGRDVRGIWEFLEWMNSEGIELKVIMEPIDTRTSNGRMLTTIFAAMAQLERDQIAERTKAGMEAKRAAGKTYGREHSIKDNPKRLEAMRPYVESGEAKTMHPKDALRILNKADRRAKAIKSEETYRRWRRDGFPGIEPQEGE